MLDTDKVYRVKRWPDIAVRIIGKPQVWEPYTCMSVTDEGDEVEVPLDEGEWVDDNSSMVLVCMVGDDHKHRVDETELIEIDELDYCASCGQIGCGHDGRDRSGVRS